MMASRPRPTPLEIPEKALTGAHADVRTYEELAQWLSREIDRGLEARAGLDSLIRDNWTRYEQGRTRKGREPWPDAADLTSPLITEYTDALHARVMETIYTDPVWHVSGWGESAQKARFVEEFHQRAAEEERLQDVLDEWILRAWHEPAGILEVSEATEWQRATQVKRIALARDPVTGAPILGDDDQPVLERDADGALVEASDPEAPSAEVQVDGWEPARVGPAYDVIPYLDFLTLPAHARNRTQVWGYAKKFYRRPPELTASVIRGVYDKKAVEALGSQDERQQGTTGPDAPFVPITTEQSGPTAQLELWEIQFTADLDGKGAQWYRATIHRDTRRLLRLQADDRTTRYLRAVPYRRPGSIDGYTLSGHKLLTVAEEDTAVRNMRADMAALAIASPILRQQGALWDPYEQPFGPRAVIDVRNPNELSQLQLRDVPRSINEWKSDIRADADRLVGQNDTSLGVDSGEDNTLGEERLRAGYAEVRVNLLVKRLKEPLEELFLARHRIWKRVLAQQQQGVLPIVERVAIGMQANGIDVPGLADGRVTPDLLEGSFWGKPRGSVETADRGRQRQDFAGLLAALGNALKVWPMLGRVLNTPEATRAILERILQINNWPNKQAFLGPDSEDALNQAAAQFNLQQHPLMQALMATAQQAPPMMGQPAQVGAPPAAPMGPMAPGPPMPGGLM